MRAFILMAIPSSIVVLVTKSSAPWATKVFMPKGHARYCSLFPPTPSGKIISGTPNRLNYCTIFIVCIQYTTVAGD